MLIKLECGYEINPEYAVIETNELNHNLNPIAHINGLVLPITKLELTLILAYHDGKSVNATLDKIKRQMDEARLKFENEELDKKLEEVFKHYCIRCVNDRKTSEICKSCSFEFEMSKDKKEVLMLCEPRKFKPLTQENKEIKKC